MIAVGFALLVIGGIAKKKLNEGRTSPLARSFIY